MNAPFRPRMDLQLIGRAWWQWVLGGALYGVGLRLLFGALPPSTQGAMSIGFLIGTPLAIGALTVHAAPQRHRSWAFCVIAPWLTVLLMLLGCALAMLEGSICLAIMAPLFLVAGSIGGVLMGIALRVVQARSRLTAVAVLPLLLLLADEQVTPQPRELEIRSSVRVEAPPRVVWQQILSARAIRADELPVSLTHLIGVPKPLEGINFHTAEGEIRQSRWERDVHFEALVSERIDQRSITWRYRFAPDSFPPGAMDEHVAIGGEYFDLIDTQFNLQPLPGNSTRLEIVAHYRVNTRINFYAVPVTQILGRDFVNTILGLYKRRSERVWPRRDTEGATATTG